MTRYRSRSRRAYRIRREKVRSIETSERDLPTTTGYFQARCGLRRLLKLEVIRQAAIPHVDTINKRQHTPLECVERVFGIQVLAKAPTKNWLPIRVDLDGVGRWKHDLSVCVPQDPCQRPSHSG
jgi:hypothetical protein